MICDILLKAAHFQVAVQATRELLFENQIYQPGHQSQLDEQANFLLLDCDLHSHDDAVEWVRLNITRLQAIVADTMRPVLTPMGWQILWVQAVDPAIWDVTLQEANGPARQDKSLIQVPTV